MIEYIEITAAVITALGILAFIVIIINVWFEEVIDAQNDTSKSGSSFRR